MKICLASFAQRQFLEKEFQDLCDFFLESFLYVKDWQIPYMQSKKLFLLDSGAFTFMNSRSYNSKNYEEYLERYIYFINKNCIDNFFNLDLDNIIGVDQTEKLTQKLEKNTGKQCIPVFHKKMGLETYKKLIDKYSYIAIGTIYEYNSNPNILRELLYLASNKKCKVHGLGFTQLKLLDTLPFYSVDSTSWLSGSRYAILYKFNGSTLQKYTKPKKTKLINYRQIDLHNLKEWCKYQKYMEGE